MSKKPRPDRKGSKSSSHSAQPAAQWASRAKGIVAAIAALTILFVTARYLQTGKKGDPAIKPYVARPAGEVTFNKDVAPIIFKNCSSCHRPEQSGPFSLLNYGDVKKHAKQIAE